MAISFLQRKRWFKATAVFLLLSIITQLFTPTVAYALTGGPSQPEVQSFEPVGTSQMVDVFTGDFNYNIPLLDVEGYPVNISYHSGVTMDQEASWVGLGWNINPGVINRNMRGLPDDFNGDKVTKEMNIRDNTSVGFVGSVGTEIVGIDGTSAKLGLTAGIGISYNNYNGIGFEQILNASISAGDRQKGALNSGLGLRSSSSDGLTITPSISFEHGIRNKLKADNTMTGSLGVSINSRSGLKALTLGVSSRGTTERGPKDNKVKSYNSGGIAGAVTFGMPSYVPASGNQMVSTSISLSAKAGTDIFAVDLFGQITGYYTNQSLAMNTEKLRAYGYLNTQKAVWNENTRMMMDFNREKDVAFTENTPALPLTSFTYDVYAVAGQGIGGTYRPYRGDMGALFDARSSNSSTGVTAGGEIAVLNLAKGGFDYVINEVETYSGGWVKDNPAFQMMKFKERQLTGDHTELNYEPYYFKEVGELSVDDEPEFYDKVGREAAVRMGLQVTKNDMLVKGREAFVSDKGQVIPISANSSRTKRVKRSQPIAFLTLYEARALGLDKDLYATGSNKVYRTENQHHIGEVTTFKSDGSRYVFGIPAYNTYQEEVTFNVGRKNGELLQQPDCEKGLVSYNDEDNSIHNERGTDQLYSKTALPAYAHSYLLTAVLSPDYVDADAVSGPSINDFGSYTKFTYNKIDQYKWRVPFDEYKANYNENLKSLDNDNQGNYIYGEKELWYLNTIESKNYIAVFTTEDRKDGYGVKGNTGGKGSISTKLLRKISLYSRNDYTANPSSATPIKEVHFEYDYSLCPNISNNGGVSEVVDGVNLNANKGKLTLKKIYFTYGKSKKGKMSPYEFNYKEAELVNSVKIYNPDYNMKGYDRWGNYKKNENASCEPDVLHAYEFPYAEQDSAKAAVSASVWSLREIRLPSGGQINVDYEADDYAYVQDQEAMRMYKLAKISASTSGIDASPSQPNALFDLNLITLQSTENMVFYFKLDKSIPNSSDVNAYRKKLLNGGNDIYFRVLVNIGRPGSGNYEYVSGYASLSTTNNFGLVSDGTSSDYTHFWVQLDRVSIGDRDNGGKLVNPLSKAAWQFGRLNAPTIVWNNEQESVNLGDDLVKTAKRLLASGFMSNIVKFFKGPNRTLLHEQCGRNVLLDKSFMRFGTPDMKKIGGGSRVKKIRVSDGWNAMVNGTDTQYGQEYTYRTEASDGSMISSGVASYEPMIGGDENALRKPVYYGDKQQNLLAPDDEHYLETPFGEAFYPAPVVGYSRVVVRNLSYENVKRHATGYTEHEFYTARDFPVRAERTSLDANRKRSNPVLRLFKIGAKDFMTASQGYVIELNDMHGKQKSIKYYAEDQEKAISGVIYKYKTSEGRLNNEATVIDPYGNIRQRNIGVDFDFVTDFREQSTTNISAGVSSNLASFFITLVPQFAPSILPVGSHEETSFRSAVSTKVINKYGLLEEVVNFDQGSMVSTFNRAYDSETGQVLLTETLNQYNDRVYSLMIPAHWTYEQMGPAYKNIGMEFIGPLTGAHLTVPDAPHYFVEGDEVAVRRAKSLSIAPKKAWVYSVQSNRVVLIDKDGELFSMSYLPVTTNVHVKIIRSGRRNLHSNQVAAYTLLRNPININENQQNDLKLSQFTETYKVINASAVEYSDAWQTYCGCAFGESGTIQLNSTNPYVNGSKGNWRAKKNYAYLSDRDKTNMNSNSFIRKDGTYALFSPFWTVPVSSSGKWLKNDAGWTWTSEVTAVNPDGQETENKDALNRYSAALYGYRQTLPVGVFSNARQKEVAVDGFEDYDFGNTCRNDHFKFKAPANAIVETQSHTGKKSIKIASGVDTIRVVRKINSCNP